MNQLYYGDNLLVLRDAIASESMNFICLDPPFKSKLECNAIFKAAKGHGSDAAGE